MLSATITMDDKDGLIAKSFAAEDREIKGKASYGVANRAGKTVFTIKAEDSTALRTVANSITKMLTVIEKMRPIK
jgi:tRNA threonylcarbamoyladenosine modification (KEOPS) complex  Pcc1 subunit